MPLDTSENDAKGTQPQLWITKCRIPSASALALQQRWIHAEFEPDGICVTTLQQTDDARLRLHPVYHNLRGLFHEGGNLPALWARARGYLNTTVVGLTWIDEYQVLLARPNEGFIGPGSLKGKRLGLPKDNVTGIDTSDINTSGIDIWRAMALRAYLTTLNIVGQGVDDVDLIDVELHHCSDTAEVTHDEAWLKTGVEALLHGDIDVLYARGSAAKRVCRMYCLDVVFDIGASGDAYTRVNNSTPIPLTVDRDFLAEHPDIVIRYLAVLLQAAKWASHNTKEARRVLAASLKIEPADLVQGYGDSLHRHLHLQLTPKLTNALIEQKNFMLKWGFITDDFHPVNWINPRPLLEAQRLVMQRGSPCGNSRDAYFSITHPAVSLMT